MSNSDSNSNSNDVINGDALFAGLPTEPPPESQSQESTPQEDGLSQPALRRLASQLQPHLFPKGMTPAQIEAKKQELMKIPVGLVMFQMMIKTCKFRELGQAIEACQQDNLPKILDDLIQCLPQYNIAQQKHALMAITCHAKQELCVAQRARAQQVFNSLKTVKKPRSKKSAKQQRKEQLRKLRMQRNRK
jgi:hypothetical protein